MRWGTRVPGYPYPGAPSTVGGTPPYLASREGTTVPGTWIPDTRGGRFPTAYPRSRRLLLVLGFLQSKVPVGNGVGTCKVLVHSWESDTVLY
eukprot:1310441-Rhodomonas_salina.1